MQQQIPLSRKKRDYLNNYVNDDTFNTNINSNYNNNNEDIKLKFNDPMWSKLWYIVS